MTTAEPGEGTPRQIEPTDRPESEHTRWWVYVSRVTEDRSLNDTGLRLGVPRSTVYRWKLGRHPDAEMVRLFAERFERPVTEAMIASGILRPEDLPLEQRPGLDLYSTTELAAEVYRRLIAKDTRNYFFHMPLIPEEPS